MTHSIVVLYHRSPPALDNVEGTQVNWQKDQSPNGIIPYLLELMSNLSNSCWISATTKKSETRDSLYTIGQGSFYTSRLYIDSIDYTSFYDIYSKQYLWPILHQYPEHVIDPTPESSQSFVKVNQLFAKAACERTAKDGTVWVHDYNLWLTPYFIKKNRPDIKVSFFFHTTFPNRQYLRDLELKSLFVDSLLECDLIGFHVPRFVNLCADWLKEYVIVQNSKEDISLEYSPIDFNLLSSFSALSEIEVVSELKTINKSVRFVAKPLPIKFVNYIEDSVNGEILSIISDQNGYENTNLEYCLNKASEIDFKECIMIIFSARCDYTKGAVELLRALRQLIINIPAIIPWLHVDFISVPSAVYNPAYIDVAKHISKLCNEINEMANREVIHLIDYCLPQKELFKMLQCSDICCVPSTYDGLNMLAKEFIATRQHNTGRLVLSRYAGASVELDEAILVNPFSVNDLLRGLLFAIIDKPKTRSHSIANMKHKILANSDDWSFYFLPFHESLKH